MRKIVEKYKYGELFTSVEKYKKKERKSQLLMKKLLKTSLIKKICLIVFLIYISVVFVNQQQTLNSYESQKEYYAMQIQDAEEHNETLLATKENLETAEYIEAISREKLDMYSKNERVYININK